MSYQNKLIGVLVIALLPYIILICFCHPSGDDFSYAFLGTKKDLYSALLDEYNLWNGRYTSNVFVLKNPLIFKDSWIWWYRFSIVGLLLFGLLSSYLFFRYFLNDSTSRSSIIFISLLFLLINLFQMPILSEGTYWYTGVVTYQLANSFTLLYLIGLHRFLVIRHGFLKFLTFIGLCLSILLIAGFNEVIMLLMLVFHGLLLVIHFQLNTINRFWFIGLFLASFFGFCIVYFAPGNKLREDYFIGESHLLGHSLFYTGLQIIRFCFVWLSSGVLILLSLVYLSVHRKLLISNKLFRNQFYINKWISLVALGAVLFIAIFPAYWSTGILGQHRTVNTAYFYFILLWFVNLSLWCNTPFFQKISVSDTLSKYSLLASIIIITFTYNSYTSWKDIYTSEASKFDKSLIKRYEILDTIPKSSFQLQQLPALKNKPASIFLYDINNDPHYFPNTCYKFYWKLNAYIISK